MIAVLAAVLLLTAGLTVALVRQRPPVPTWRYRAGIDPGPFDGTIGHPFDIPIIVSEHIPSGTVFLFNQDRLMLVEERLAMAVLRPTDVVRITALP